MRAIWSEGSRELARDPAELVPEELPQEMVLDWLAHEAAWRRACMVGARCEAETLVRLARMAGRN